MLSLLDKEFNVLGTLGNILQANVTKQDSGSWSISATVVQDGALVNQIKRENYIEFEGQKFTIQEVTVGREGEKRTVSFITQHIFHELEDQVVAQEYQHRGTISQHINRLLQHQQGSDFHYQQGPVHSDIYTIVRTITIRTGNLADNLRTILQHYNARLILDNYIIKPVHQLYVPQSGVTLEYSVTNRNITRTYNRDPVVTRLICKGQVGEGESAAELEKTYGGDGNYRNGITRYMDFGQLDKEADMDWLANDYLSVYSNPDATYELDFVELGRLSGAETLYPGQNFEIDTGVGVRVLDNDLNVDEIVPVKSYSYSLVDDKAPSRITLGSFRTTKIPDERLNNVRKNTDTLLEETRAVTWAETVMNYVSKVIGGTIRDVDPGLLIFVQPIVSEKALFGAVQTLALITPGYNGPKYNAPFTIRDPLAEIKRKKIRYIQTAYREIEQYISRTAGPGTSTIVTLINQAYNSAYGGPGQVVAYPNDIGSVVFADAFETGSQEMYYANRVVERLNSEIGNISSLYLEIGGGNGGAIGCINKLYGMLSGHGINVSAGAPDNNVGKDGDLWFQFEDASEE